MTTHWVEVTTVKRIELTLPDLTPEAIASFRKVMFDVEGPDDIIRYVGAAVSWADEGLPYAFVEGVGEVQFTVEDADCISEILVQPK